MGVDPGFTAGIASTEGQIWWSRWGGEGVASQRVKIDSTVEDSGNTNFVTTLRPGNIIGIKISDGNGYLYDPDATDGTERPAGVLHHAVKMLNAQGTAADQNENFIINGLLHRNDLIGLDAHAEGVFASRGLYLDDQTPNPASFGVHMLRQQFKITDYTVTVADNGTLFIASTADCEFTLPTIAAGLCYEFLMTANQELKITGSSNIVTINNLSASSITYTVTAQQIGVHLRVRSVYTAASTLKWVVEALHNNAAIFVVGAIA